MKVDENWNHPFANLLKISKAKKLLEKVQDDEISDDKYHLKTGKHLIKQAYEDVFDECAKADLTLSDSCTCTSLHMNT